MFHARLAGSRAGLWTCVLGLLAALLAGCAQRIPAPLEQAEAPAVFPEAYYRELKARGAKVLRVNPERSLVAIEVRRAGALAGMGHDHVVASHDVTGYVAPQEGRADLSIALDRLTVDEPVLRTEAGLGRQPPQDAVEDTRRNMREHVLESQRFPLALVRATRKDSNSRTSSVSITLHGTTREYQVPLRIETNPDGITVSGRMSLNQTDFGIVPFSLLGGALSVRDRVDVHFRIIAEER